MKLSPLFAAAAFAFALAGPPAFAQSEEREPYREIIVVRTPQGVVTTYDGQQLFDRLQDDPYHFQPGNVYQYPAASCTAQRGCQVVVTRERTGRYVDTIMAPPLQASMHSMRDTSAATRSNQRDPYNSRYSGDRYERTYRSQEQLGDQRDPGRYEGDRHQRNDRYRNDEPYDDEDEGEPEG